MILRSCLALLRAAAGGLARLAGRPDRRVRVVRLPPAAHPGIGRTAYRRPDGIRRAGPGRR